VQKAFPIYFVIAGDDSERVTEAIDMGKRMIHNARPLNYQGHPSQQGANKRASKQAENRKTKRALKKAERSANGAKQVVFISPRKKERCQTDSSDENEEVLDHCCCKKYGCTEKFKVTGEDYQGVLAVAYFRDKFKAMSSEQQAWFISERVKIVNGRNQTYLESLEVMQGYHASKSEVPTRLTALLTEDNRCCRDYFDWVLNISRDRISQPGSGSPGFHPEAARNGRLRANATRPAKVWNLVVQWLLVIATFYLHDPTKPHIYMPFAHRQAVHDLFESEQREDDEADICSPSYFNYVWGNDPGLKHIRLRKHIRFALCPLCVKYMSARYHTMAEVDRTKLKAAEFAHSRFVRAERQAYYNRRRMACLYKKEYFSVIIDGADQAAYSMPHFTMLDKDTSQAMRIRNHLFGAIVHGRALYGFSYLDNCKHGTNLTIEALHRVLIKEWIRGGKGRLPRVLFLQLDNCSKQNKSQYLIAYLGLLVGWDVFEEVILSFLPVGHTHEDIDQLFSRIAVFLRKNDARARQEFHEAFCTACASKKWGDDVIPEAVHTQAESMPYAANFSDLVEQQGLTEKDATRQNRSKNRVGLSNFHQFKLFKDQETGKVSMLISEWCANPVYRSNVEQNGKPAVTLSGSPLPHVVFKDGVTPVVDVLHLMPAMQRKDTAKNWRVHKRTGETYNIIDRQQRKGVESVIKEREVPDDLAADLQECLGLLEDTTEFPHLWDTELYEVHALLGPRSHGTNGQGQEDVGEAGDPRPDDGPPQEADSEAGEEEGNYLLPDDEGYAPERNEFVEGDVWLVPEIDRDPEHLGWGLCQVKGDPKLARIEDKDYCGDNGDALHGLYWVVPVMWLMPSQKPRAKDDIALDTFVRNQRKHTTSEKGWDTIFARSMLRAVSVTKSGAAGFKVREPDRDCIRETHAKAQESAPLRLRAQKPNKKRRHGSEGQVSRGEAQNSKPKRRKTAADSELGRTRPTRAQKNTYSDERRREIATNLMLDDQQTYYQAWENSLALAIAEFNG
jgi:hypothetical protein